MFAMIGKEEGSSCIRMLLQEAAKFRARVSGCPEYGIHEGEEDSW